MKAKGRKGKVGRKRRTPGIGEYADIVIKAALAEDVGAGDITTDAIVPPGLRGAAEIVAKEDIVVAGLFVAQRVFKALDRGIRFTPLARDGERVRRGARIAALSGRLKSVITGERVALNFLQRLSGIATLTARFVDKVRHTNVTILDTRKTTPCMRILEKYAVKAGGGANHRRGLFDSILMKDNHIKAAGSIREAVDRVNRRYPEGTVKEVEATTLREVREAVSAGADIIMLDNMKIDRIRKAKALIGGRALVEVSGGVSLENVRSLAATGVDFISIGALTHSARAVDISMEVVDYAGRKKR